MGGRPATVAVVARASWGDIADGVRSLFGASRALRGARLEVHRAVWVRRGRVGAAGEPLLVADVTVVPAAAAGAPWRPRLLEFVATAGDEGSGRRAVVAVDALRMPSGGPVPARVSGQLRFQVVLRVSEAATRISGRYCGETLEGAFLVPRDESLSVVLTPPSRDDAVQVLRGHEAPVTSLAARPQGVLVSGDAWGRLHTWTRQGAHVDQPSAGPGAVHAIAFLEDESCVYSCGESLVIRRAFSNAAERLGDHRGREVVPVRALPGGRVVSGGYDGTVRLWEPGLGPAGPPLPTVQFVSPVVALAVHPDGATLACGLEDGTLLLLDAATLSERGRREKAHGGDIYAVAFHPSEDLLVSAGATDSAVKCWDLELRPLRTLDAGAPVSTVAFSADGALFAEAAGNRVVVRETRDWRVVVTLEGHASVVSAIVFLTGGALASSSFDGTVRVWRVGA